MAFGGRTGVSLEIPEPFSITSFLMNEEIGEIQVGKCKNGTNHQYIKPQKIIRDHFYIIGSVRNDKKLQLDMRKKTWQFNSRFSKVYSETSILIQKIETTRLLQKKN